MTGFDLVTQSRRDATAARSARTDVHSHSWHSLPAAQQPDWSDASARSTTIAELSSSPPLVLPAECDRLRAELAAVARGEALVLQGGDCAETFAGITAEQIHSKLSTLMQMAVVLAYECSVPVVPIGRIAGQYSKPRSAPTETRDGVTLPAYRGDGVNGRDFTPSARASDARRLRRMYDSSAATLNLLRALAAEGYAGLWRPGEWERDLLEAARRTASSARVRMIDNTLRFMQACGIDRPALQPMNFFTSHEALILDYEGALARTDSTGRLYGLSGHYLWIGERTRQLAGAHIEFAARIHNPLAVKLGPAVTADEVVALLDRLDPAREPGRLTFITRLGADLVRDVLPALIEKARAHGGQPIWMCDPMHANTFRTRSGHKTRHLETIIAEVVGFFEVHRALGTHPGGIHVELTGDYVTECLGGADRISADDLHLRYETACDPRLNRRQALELAFAAAELYGRRAAGRQAGELFVPPLGAQ